MTRQHKTPKQRAEEALGIADRLVGRLETKRDALQDELRDVVHELNAAVVRRDYLAQHPDLGQPATSTTTTSTGDNT